MNAHGLRCIAALNKRAFMITREAVKRCVFENVENVQENSFIDMFFVGPIPINVPSSYGDDVNENLRLIDDLGMDSIDIYGLISDSCRCVGISPDELGNSHNPNTIKDVIDLIFNAYMKKNPRHDI